MSRNTRNADRKTDPKRTAAAKRRTLDRKAQRNLKTSARSN